MKNIILTLTVAASVAVAVKAQNPATEETRIPQRVVVVSGDTTKMKPEVVAVIYDSNDLKFHDPSAPRFLFLTSPVRRSVIGAPSREIGVLMVFSSPVVFTATRR